MLQVEWKWALHDKNYLQISLDIYLYIKRKLRSRNGFSVTINSYRTNLEKDYHKKKSRNGDLKAGIFAAFLHSRKLRWNRTVLTLVLVHTQFPFFWLRSTSGIERFDILLSSYSNSSDNFNVSKHA